MAEQPATNQNRPALYRIAAGTTLKGAHVELLGTGDEKPLDALKPMDKVWVREFLDYRLNADQPLREAMVLWRNLDRVFRTPQETELGRDFTDEEAAEHERLGRLRVAQHMVEHRAESINIRLTQIAERLERSAAEVRRLIASGYSLNQKGLAGAARSGVAGPQPERRPADDRPGGLAADGRRDQAARWGERGRPLSSKATPSSRPGASQVCFVMRHLDAALLF
jgi:hypothetical protein